MSNKPFILGMLLFVTVLLQSQEPSLNYPIIDEQCGSVHMHEWRQQNLPNVESDQQFEEWISHKMLDVDFSNREVLTIPVVVHVIHNGEPIGTLPNITDAQVISQIDVLNEDFRRIAGSNGFNTHPDGADVELEFCLAAIDPQGNPTNGIDRQNLGQDTWGSGSADGTMKPNTYWDPEQYFNIWVCNLSQGLLGYAQFPSSSGLQGFNNNEGGASTDGVVVGAQYFGSADKDDGTFQLDFPYNLGRTLTHEIGHSFGLRHIWGDGGCNVDDYCADTPESDGSNGGCPTGELSCGTIDMIENYMDYTYDACMNIFTNDQKVRVLAVMENSPRRVNLPSSIVCNPPASFAFAGQVIDAETQEGIPGAKVKFSGTFSPEATTGTDGTFAVSTLYEGDYEVLAGSWGYVTETMTNQYFDQNTGSFIIELDRGYYDDFVLDFEWSVTGNAETGVWVREEPIGSDYNGTLYDPADDIVGDFGEDCYLTGNSGGGAGSNDVDNGTTTLTSPVFDGTLYENPKISFYRWFMTGGGQGATPDDILEISLSNGSQTVVLETVDINSSDLGEWVFKEFVISDYMAVTNNMTFSLSTSDQVTSSEGHLVDAALDLFRVVEGESTSVDDALADELEFNLSPNPSQGNYNINLNHLETNAQINVFDALGRSVFSNEVSNGNSMIDITNEASGIYFLQVTVEGRSFVRKLMKQ